MCESESDKAPVRQRRKGRIAVTIGLLLLVGPVVFQLLLHIFSFIYPDDCDISARCDHRIVEMAMIMGFGNLILGPLLMLAGATLLIGTGAVYGLKAFRNRPTKGQGWWRPKQLIGVLCAAILLYMAYIPKGPDECSRAVTDSRYEACLANIFAGMTIAQTRGWLEERGYEVGMVNRYVGGYTTAREFYEEKERPYAHDFTFAAYRGYGYGRSIPYGTNFNRLFGRIPPAPGSFKLILFGVTDEDIVFGVQAEWSFSFL